ncbi:Arc family DNA-binding protein [Celeribacter halophilus]|uniref:Arc family DNA-binding protein n=1 Tax=Celeribacter halophilus TaxID=576117 RepID=UPI0026E1CF60|nr:Arc family DNA-binding protein [Celeribacter halophilus]MDO6722778.1 Arc family DNA-binding protein [Celeribacter halophilus]
MSSKAGRGSDQFVVRMPDGMRDRIKLAADMNGRSMNAEIIATLEEKYPPNMDDPQRVELYRLLTKFIHNKDEFTDDDEYKLNSLVVEMRLTPDKK